MPRQCVCGPPWQALTVEQIAALLGAANPSSPTSLSVAAFIAKNVVNGNRAAQEWLLQWNEVARAERGGVMVGVTTSVGLTKTDRRYPTYRQTRYPTYRQTRLRNDHHTSNP